MSRAPYAPLEHFVAPARARAEIWRLLLGIVLIVAIYLGALFLFGLGLSRAFGAHVANEILARMERADTPGSALLLLYSFLAMAIGPMVAVRLLHKRSAATLFGPSIAAAAHDFRRLALPLAGLQVITLPLVLLSGGLQPGLALASFLLYLPFAALGVLVQVGAEELVFRGYLQQQLAARFRHSAIWMGVPALLFSFGHYAPAQFGPNAPMIVLWAFVFACLASDLTARTGTIGAALAFHFFNNLTAFLLIAPSGNLDGLALWTLDIDISDASGFRAALVADLLAIIIAWLVARLSLRV
ncbi:MAG: CPBP family intramembrane metalloprotease [Rhodobacteraceae bacterium]|nr:CPBP family intramembrane metalloprotease [Paracoccaceae bacterium]